MATKGKKVLKTTPNDKVFIFFSDHGSPGLIAFPSKYLYADQLLQTFNKITGKFDKLVFYLEVPIIPYRHANQAQCSKNCQLTLTSTVSLLQIPANLRGELTAVPTTWSKASMWDPASAIYSVSTSCKTSTRATSGTRLYWINSKS